MINFKEELPTEDILRPGFYTNTLKRCEKSFELFPAPQSLINCKSRPFMHHIVRINTPITSIRAFPFDPYFAIGTINSIFIISSKLDATINLPYKDTVLIENIDVHPSSMFLACNGPSNNIQIISLQNNCSIMTLNLHKKKISSVYFLPSVSKFYSTGYDGQIIISDLIKKKECFRYTKLESADRSITTSSIKEDETIISVGLENGEIGLFDHRENEEMTSISAHTQWVNSIGFAEPNLYMASCSLDQTLKVWDLRNLTVPVMKQEKIGAGLSKVLFINDSVLAVTTVDGRLIRWDFKNGTLLSMNQLRDFGLYSCDIQKDLERLIVSAEDKVVSLFYYDL